MHTVSQVRMCRLAPYRTFENLAVGGNTTALVQADAVARHTITR